MNIKGFRRMLLVRSSNLNKTSLDIYAKAALDIKSRFSCFYLFRLFFLIIFLLLRYT